LAQNKLVETKNSEFSTDCVLENDLVDYFKTLH